MDDLRRIDLNLLLTLHALLTEQHVTRAAVRLHKSQPAVSHALAQLRDIFDDPLLVRRENGLTLTARARDLLGPLDDALGQLNGLVGESTFDAAHARRCFRLALSDYGARSVLPALMRRLRREAPGIDVAVVQAGREAMLAQLADGETDLAIGVFPRLPSDIEVATLFEDHYTSVADRATLPRRGPLSVEDWLARPHVLVAMRPDAPSEIDLALAEAGMQRHVALVLPHWGAALDLVPGTDLILTVATRAVAAAPNRALRAFAPPIALAPVPFQQAWHARRRADPAHRWLRQTVWECSQQPEGT
ncbi:DNA-binding transcriptional LysR family regulator [Cupriavidus metallidurans]|jgi:DNA-binding transcriptional LysR family regulator|uniref:LysR family transcriptional regulator n=1 Tax=Cupriavidus TaxID=106589 RepID=UPI0004937E54|nr:LysR family transcriptional regulator [Cupriavidus metallidurans]AVA35774.1 LysR family transcriptional regulator [Cupriavidus metallidurans]KWW35626.1 PCP degradation transcriptional activation protein [Cupriavidus metallidurans]MDE4921767.1 LysR family transcriptional regulator [Cupriavidus metallidurans]UBM08587.1 LysR family transcriptional regulator [Cupriavidus metallidurans]